MDVDLFRWFEVWVLIISGRHGAPASVLILNFSGDQISSGP